MRLPRSLRLEHDQTPNDPVVQRLVLAALKSTSGPLPKSYAPSRV